MIALGPDFGVFQVPEEHPLPGAIANPDATSFDHNSQELRNVVLGDDIIDHDEDRAASRFDVDLQFRFAELIQGIEV